VDLSEDVYALPARHPGYAKYGPGCAARLRELDALLAKAHMLTVPTPALAERLAGRVPAVAMLPHAWSQANPLWDKPAPRRGTLNLGLVVPGALPDLAALRPALQQLLALPDVLVVVVGRPEAFHALGSLPETRRQFLPLVAADLFPYLLAHLDVLMQPLLDGDDELPGSDLSLLHAGARRLPWVAAATPASRGWGAGGLLIERPGQWRAALAQLAGDAQLRVQMGQAGRAQADAREAAVLQPLWLPALLGEPAAPER
jgi:hypothetical protein